MRKDIIIEKIIKEGVKMNKSELARQYGCCWETIDRRINPEKYKKEHKPRVYTSKLDAFKDIIDSKLENQNIPATGIYFLLKTKYDFAGKYGIVKKYVRAKKNSIITNLTIRFETLPGYQSQVDWKEEMKLHDKSGNSYVINIFLMVLGYSRLKYIEITFDKTKSTLYKCLINAFKYFKGTTNEILFDNMKTVVDQAKSNYNEVIINQETESFSKDAGFKIVTCRAYRPRTKGKVETLAKIMNRLKAYDYEFDYLDELYVVVNKLLKQLNEEEKSSGTNEIPTERYAKEKEYLIPVNFELLNHHCKSREKLYKVSNESMITYQGIKYSVPIKYVGKNMILLEDNGYIHIYYNLNIVCSYKKNNNFRYNYKKEDYIDILRESVFDYKTNEEIEKHIKQNLNYLDGINIEEN